MVIYFLAAVGLALVFYLIFRKKQIANRPPSQTLLLGDLHVHYNDVGSGGRTFVLIHGLGASLYCFRLIIPILAKHGRVIALDLPGFGQSEKRLDLSYDIDQQAERIGLFCEALKIRDAIVVGSSMGGLLAFYLALKKPDLVGHLVTISPALYVRTFVPQWVMRKSWFMGRMLNAAVMARALKSVVARHELIDQDVISNYLSPYSDPNSFRILLRALESLSETRWTEELKNFSKPNLMLWGTKDRVLSVKLAEHVRKSFPQTQIFIHQEGGHHLQEDDPVWVSQKILDFTLQKY